MTTCTLDARKARWRGQVTGEQPPAHLFLIWCDPDPLPVPLPWPSLKEERIEWAWQDYCRHRERAEWLRDDSLPCLNIRTGTEIFAEAFGCKVHRPDDNMPFALPCITDASRVDQLQVPDLDVPPLAILFEMADALRARAGRDALVKMVDIQSPMDIAALIWDKNDFYTAMVEAPEAVKALSAKVTQLLTTFLDAWFARYGADFVAHYPSYYMPFGITLSEDEVGAVSAEMFEEFFLPELQTLSTRYGALGMHCCANSRHQWDNFLRIPGLRVLNICQPVEVIRAAYPFFAEHVLQFHGGLDGPAWTWPAQLPPNSRAVIETWAATPDEARDTADRLWEACGR